MTIDPIELSTDSSAPISRPVEASPATQSTALGRIALAGTALVWLLIGAAILRQPLFVSLDSVSNDAHVWYVSQQLWQAHRIPYHLPLLGHGQALAFPYALLPWLSAAVAERWLGDWAVSLWLILGLLGTVAASFWAFPELRDGWWAACLLVEPALVTAVIAGELPFLWAVALLLGAIACWRRGRAAGAVAFAALAQATHPAVLLPLTGLLVLGWLRWAPRPRALLTGYALSLLVALPAAWLVLTSPVVGDTSLTTKVVNLAGTVGERLWVVALPIGLVALRRRGAGWLPPATFATLLLLNLALVPPLGLGFAWRGLDRAPDHQLDALLDGPAFQPGATYRLLRGGDGKVGMYQLIQHGGRLDSEFFPESIDRRSWSDRADYLAFLRRRRVDAVVIFDDYDRDFGTNEHRLLAQLAAEPTGCASGQGCVALIQQTPAFDVYAIRFPG